MLTGKALSILALLAQTQGGAGPNGDLRAPADSLVFSGRAGEMNVTAPRIDDPEINIDGRLDEAAWQRAALLTDFTQYEPNEGIAADDRTEVRIFYSTDAMYFGVVAYDRQPELILARLGDRDQVIFRDDWVRLMLDTFNDQRQAYIFYVNPLGLQGDGLWIEGMNNDGPVPIDFNLDFIFDSDAQITDDGWTAEIRIPYVSLRFREVPVQAWGFNVAREVRRRGFKQSWAPLTKNVSSTLAQSGRLVGLQGLQSRRLVEFNPVATGRTVGERTDAGVFEREALEPDFGFNTRFGVTQNLVLDATANPDFSQVEADANQLTVNERFDIFVSEKRPFFLDGAEIFRSPRNLVYTRRIVDPAAGAKLTGKIGSLSVGYLGAVDEAPRTIFDTGDDPALFNLLRVRRDVGRGSTIGLLYTDRSVMGSGIYNRVLAGDVRWLIGDRNTLTSQFAGSWSADGPDSAGTMEPLVSVEFERSGRNFELNLKVDDVHPAFRTETGFIPRVGDTQTFAEARGTTYGAPGATVERLAGAVRFDGYFDHDEFWDGATPFEWEVELNPTIAFRGGRSINVILRDGYFRFRPEAYVGYALSNPDGTTQPFAVPPPVEHIKGIAIIPNVRINNQVQLEGRFFYREVPIYVEAGRGLEVQIAPQLQVRPTTSLQLELEHTYSRIRRQRDHTRFSTVHISRVRTQYQFNKALFIRAIVQYNLEDRSALRDPTTERPLVIDGVVQDRREEGTFEGQFLASYEPSPGTIFFIGYSRLMEGDRTYRLSRMDPVADGLFVKLSYLFRL